MKKILLLLLVSIFVLSGCDNEKATNTDTESDQNNTNEVNNGGDTEPEVTVLYYVDSGDTTPTVLETDQETGTLNPEVEDQEFIVDDDPETTDTTWGYYSTAGGVSPDDGSGDSADPYTVNRRGWWGVNDEYATILYVFEVPENKSYDIEVGAVMPSGWSSRDQALVINGVVTDDDYVTVGESQTVFTVSATPVDSTFVGEGITSNAAESLLEDKFYLLVEMRGNTRKGDDSGYEDPVINVIKISE